jgi:hypothetical protein
MENSKNRQKKSKKRWTHQERQFVRENAGKMKDTELLVALKHFSGRDITITVLRKARTRMGIHKLPGRNRSVVDPYYKDVFVRNRWESPDMF